MLDALGALFETSGKFSARGWREIPAARKWVRSGTKMRRSVAGEILARLPRLALGKTTG